MLVEERRQRILDGVQSAGTVSTDELARQLEVSIETIRRDLVSLDRERLLRRVHGGAMALLPRQQEEAPFAIRRESAAEAKRRIGDLAAALVKPGQTIVIDIGTTTVAVARALPTNLRATVITCSLLVAAELATRPNIELFIAPGRVRPGDLAVSGPKTVAWFHDIYPDIAFLGSGAVSAESGLTDYYIDEIATRQTILANAAAAYVLADASKLGKAAPHRVCPLDAITSIITDQPPTAQTSAAIEHAGGDLIYPGAIAGQRRGDG